MVVVLPAPFAPMKPKILPSGTSKEMSLMTLFLPKLLERFLMERVGALVSGFSVMNPRGRERSKGWGRWC